METFVSFLLFKSASYFFFCILHKNISTNTGNVEEKSEAYFFTTR